MIKTFAYCSSPFWKKGGYSNRLRPSVPANIQWSMSFIPSIILVKKRRKSNKPVGLCGNFTGLWGKMPYKDQRKCTSTPNVGTSVRLSVCHTFVSGP
jgi:hypothetical protein